ncbi:MAG TPA: hypothetical protein PLU11_09135 [Chitinophagaceae bacterium]|nr:hypothetical protein [Chitinophagaceae bacterium]HPH32178.1 hypothetical protein [Chitinophagaceae bacterium]HPN59325.1 hypothetical protein [Chitinophagaceae bacterium]
MKKIFTLVAALFLTVALFAADRRPVIKLNNNNNYKVVIDGRAYFGDDINIHPDQFLRGKHTVKVFEMKRGFFGRTERLVDVTTFFIDRDDVVIRIDRMGRILVREERKGNWNNGNGKNQRDRNDDRYDRNDRPVRRF